MVYYDHHEHREGDYNVQKRDGKQDGYIYLKDTVEEGDETGVVEWLQREDRYK